MKHKEILLFGASGQIGRNLVRKLSQNNYRITAVTRNIHRAGYLLKTQANPGYLNIVEINRFNSDEIEACFGVPVKFLLEDKRHRNDEINRDGDKFFMPAYEYDSYIIWGLTAMMTVDFLNVALDANIDLKTKGN